jgi:hypothetical protein
LDPHISLTGNEGGFVKMWFNNAIQEGKVEKEKFGDRARGKSHR